MIKSSEPILEILNLSNHYEGQPLIQDVSFSLEQGEILCLLGPSGSGKTTLLRLIAGLEQEAEGTILFQGQNIKEIPPHRRNFGMMFQEYALFPHKDVWHNVSFGLEMQHCSLSQQKQRVETTLKMVGLAGFEHRKIDELSGGERQRVALARSLAPQPQLLLLDEPLGSLDRTLRDRLTIEIRSILKKLQVTAVFVTHDQAEAFSIADKVAILHNGVMQQLDTPEGLYRHPANKAIARFLGFSNLIDGALNADGIFHSSAGTLKISEESIQCPKESPITLLLRPEGAHLTGGSHLQTACSRISGRVLSRQFHGSRYKVELESGDIRLTFELPIDPVPPMKGQSINLEIRQSSIVLIDD